jgi:hypothetical protein
VARYTNTKNNKPDPATYQLKVQKTILAKIQKQAAALGYKLLPTALVPA